MDRGFWKTVAASTLGVLIAAAILHGLALLGVISVRDPVRDALGRLNKSVAAYPVKPAKAAPEPASTTAADTAAGTPYTGPLRIAPGSDIPAAPLSSLSPEARERVQKDSAQKEAAWQKFYQRPQGCEKAEGPVFIECANHHIRARRSFETLYAAGKL